MSAFLEYLAALRDVGAREGEAPAGEGGALQLMTIHKAKGLEFDLVVLADASRLSPRRAEPIYLMEEIGVSRRDGSSRRGAARLSVGESLGRRSISIRGGSIVVRRGDACA